MNDQEISTPTASWDNVIANVAENASARHTRDQAPTSAGRSRSRGCDKLTRIPLTKAYNCELPHIHAVCRRASDKPNPPVERVAGTTTSRRRFSVCAHHQ